MGRFFKNRFAVIGVVLVVIALLAFAGMSMAAATKSAPLNTVQISRGDIQSQVLSSAALQPANDLTLTFGSAGTISSIPVKLGQTVEKGQTIAQLDPSELNLAVTQAEASLSSARAKLESVKAGSATKDVANAEAALRSAQAKLDSLKLGPTFSDLASAQAAVVSAQAKLTALKLGPTPQDLANAQAALRSAQAKLATAKAGSTPQDIANAQSTLKSAQAKLDQVKAGSTPEDIANAQSTLVAAQAKLDQLKQGPTQSDLTAAESSLKSAQSKMAALKAGPTQADLSAAQLKVTQAQTSLDKTTSSASLAKQQDDITLHKALNDLQNAQDAYRVIAALALDANGNLVTVLPPELAHQYKDLQALIDDYNTKLRAMQNAQGDLNKAQLAYDDARRQEAEGVQAAQAQLDDAKTQLKNLTSGPTAADLAAAQASVDQAQSSLDKLKAPPTAADLASAQAAVDQAKNNLAKLKQGSTAADIAAAQASVDQAQNNLNKLKQGPTPEDVTQAQAAVDQAQASLDKLKAPPTAADVAAAQAGVAQAQANLDKLKAPPTQDDTIQAQAAVDQAENNLEALKAGPAASDLAAAQATVDQAQANLDSAKLKVADANLVAPFSGVIADLPVTAGQSVSANATVAELVDNSSYHLDMNVGEADISQVKVGQPVDLTFDALSGQVYTGTVTYVAPKATISQGVVNYLATVTIDPKAGGSDLRPGMSATAAAIVDSHDNVLMVANRAVRTEGRQKVVYVVGPGGTQVRVPIQAGISDGSSTEIVSCANTGNQCLREGDSVVIPASTSSTSTGARPGGGLIGIGGGRPGR